MPSSVAAMTRTSSGRTPRYIPEMTSRSAGAPGDSVYPHQCLRRRSCDPGSRSSSSWTVRDSASELESRYLAVNSYFPKILFDAKGLDLHGRESGKACPPASRAKLPRAEFLHGKGGNVPRVQLRTAAGYDYEAPSPWQSHVLRSASPWLTALP